MSNPFFKNQGPFNLRVKNFLKINSAIMNKEFEINDIKDLQSSTDKDITFFHSKKYKDIAKKTKAAVCLTTEVLKKELPETCVPLVVDNVLVSISKLTSKFYPESIYDEFDETVSLIEDTEFKSKIKFGKNILIGKNVSIGNNCKIGHNTIIEKNVVIGNNCSIGSNTIIRNSIVKKI